VRPQLDGAVMPYYKRKLCRDGQYQIANVLLTERSDRLKDARRAFRRQCAAQQIASSPAAAEMRRSCAASGVRLSVGV